MSFGTDRRMDAMTDVNTRWCRWRPRVINDNNIHRHRYRLDISACQILWYSFQEICQQTRRNLKMWWTNERTDNYTHKPQWQPHFSKVIWPQFPNPSPCTVGRTDEHMKWQQYHQHQCRLMMRHLDISMPNFMSFFQVICQRNCLTKQMLQNGRN